MKHKVLAAAGAMISVIGMSIAAAAPASAKPVEHDHFVDSGRVIIQVGDPLFCPGIVDFPVLHEWNAEGMFLLVERGDGQTYLVSPARATDTWTNTVNRETFTVSFVGQNRDHKITDNGDGTRTVEFATVGLQKVYGPDGQLLFMDTGLFRGEVLIDHAGTPADPSDDEFTFLRDTAAHGQKDTLDRNFCEDLVTFIG
jgi:hypothetical protein